MSDQIQIELKGQNHPFAYLIKGQEELNKAFISSTQSTLSEVNLDYKYAVLLEDNACPIEPYRKNLSYYYVRKIITDANKNVPDWSIIRMYSFNSKNIAYTGGDFEFEEV